MREGYYVSDDNQHSSGGWEGLVVASDLGDMNLDTFKTVNISLALNGDNIYQ